MFFSPLFSNVNALASDSNILYTASSYPNSAILGTRNLKISDNDSIAYCYNIHKEWPEIYTQGGTSGYTKLVYGKHIDPSYSDNIKKVIYAGFPTNSLHYGDNLSNDEFQATTQYAIWHFTDGLTRNDVIEKMQSYGGSEDTIKKVMPIYDLLVAGNFTNPANFVLNFYNSPTNQYQNLLGGQGILTKTEVEFSKVAAGQLNELKGATLTVKSTDEQNFEETWVSTEIQKN